MKYKLECCSASTWVCAHECLTKIMPLQWSGMFLVLMTRVLHFHWYSPIPMLGFSLSVSSLNCSCGGHCVSRQRRKLIRWQPRVKQACTGRGNHQTWIRLELTSLHRVLPAGYQTDHKWRTWQTSSLALSANSSKLHPCDGRRWGFVPWNIKSGVHSGLCEAS